MRGALLLFPGELQVDLTPEQEIQERRRNCARQMKLFDRLSEPARKRLIAADHDVDLEEIEHQLKCRGPSDRARATLKARGVLPCDLSPEDLLSLEVEVR